MRAVVAELRHEEGPQDVGIVLRRLPASPSALTLMLSTATSPSFLITYRSIQVRKKKGSAGTSFSALQASTHRLQPMHLSTSTPIP